MEKTKRAINFLIITLYILTLVILLCSIGAVIGINKVPKLDEVQKQLVRTWGVLGIALGLATLFVTIVLDMLSGQMFKKT